jgi:hypothetical protein
MAAAIPAIVTFVQAGSTIAGVASMATASLAGFLQVGGAVLGAVGAVTGKKGLQKFGALMSLGAGLTNLATGAANAGASAAEGAAGEALKTGVQAGAESASASVSGQIGGVADSWAETALAGVGKSGGATAGSTMFDSAASQWAGGAASDLAAAAGDTLYGKAGVDLLAGGSSVAADPFGVQTITDRLMSEGSKLRQNDIDAALGKLGKGLQKGAQWIKENPELSKFGFSILEGIYGPEAEQMDMQRKMMDRRRNNLNSPIRLTNTGMGG